MKRKRMLIPVLLMTLSLCFMKAVFIRNHSGYFLFGPAIDLLVLIVMATLLVVLFVKWVQCSLVWCEGAGKAPTGKRKWTRKHTLQLLISIPLLLVAAMLFVIAFQMDYGSRYPEEFHRNVFVYSGVTIVFVIPLVLSLCSDFFRDCRRNLPTFAIYEIPEGAISREEVIAIAQAHLQKANYTLEDMEPKEATLFQNFTENKCIWKIQYGVRIPSDTDLIQVDAYTGEIEYSFWDEYYAQEILITETDAIVLAREYALSQGWNIEEASYAHALLHPGGRHSRWSVFLAIGTSNPVIWVNINARDGEIMSGMRTEESGKRDDGANESYAEIP